MKVVLPRKEPICSCYSQFGILFSIIQEPSMPWVYNNFQQLRFSTGWDMITFDCHNFILTHCPKINFKTLPKFVITSVYHGDFKGIIVDFVGSQNYIYAYLDRYYLKGTKEYQKTHYIHDLLIFGFDEENDIVYLADNINKGKYCVYESTFEEISNAYPVNNSDFDYRCDVSILSLNPDSAIDINVNQIIDGLERYIDSKPTFDIKYEHKCFFGQKAIEYIRDLLDSGERCDMRDYQLWMEQKILLEKCAEYLEGGGILNKDREHSQKIKDLRKRIEKLRNLVLVYIFKGKKKGKEDILCSFNSILDLERELYRELILDLKEYIATQNYVSYIN